MRRVLTVVVVLVIIGGAGFLALRVFASGESASNAKYDAIMVGRGTLISTVSAIGMIASEERLALNFEASGRVAEVLVETGDVVQKDQLLARLESDELGLQLRAAEASLVVTEAQVRILKAPPNASDLAAAEAQLVSAQAQYNEVLDGPETDQIGLAKVQLEKAQAALSQAQAGYDKVKDKPNIGALPQSLQLQQATLDYEAAQANYRLTIQGASNAQTAAALAQVAQAEANLDRLERGASDEDITIAEAQVEQARIQVEQVQLAIENMKLIAPMAGTMVAVNIRANELLAAGLQPAMVLQDDSQFHIDVDVDEIDIGGVREGQDVVVSVDALPDVRLIGEVDRISPEANQQTGISTYGVTVLLESADVPLRAGMSATASITVESLQDILVIPNWAVQLDRTEGKAYVEILVDGEPVRSEVRLGLRSDSRSQVLEGLQDGDIVVIRTGNRQGQLRDLFGG